MNKNGIITFHGAINYGAALQAVALNKCLTDIQGNSEIIDYKNEKFKKLYGFQTDFKTKNLLKKFILIIIKNCFFIVKKIKFNIFLKKYSTISKRKYFLNNIKQANNDYDCIITGSDQVFNLELTGNDKTYFLDFADENKIKSYAASFGFEYLDTNLESIYKHLLNRFSYLSIREKSGCCICNKLVTKKIYQHVDPTLLLTGLQWKDLLKLKIRDNREKYILLYTVATPDKLINYVEKMANEMNLDVIEIGNNLKKTRKNFKYLRSCGPKEFLDLILNAQFIATTSFHGTAFGILFHKKMWIETVDSFGKNNVRINSLLDICGIRKTNNETLICLENTDWDLVEDNLNKQRNYSFEYLKQIQ